MTPKRRMQTPPMTGVGMLRMTAASLPTKEMTIAEDRRAADDPDAEDARDGHDADVLAVGRVGRGADESGQDVREAVAEQRAVEAGVLHEVAPDDVAGDDEVADVLGEHDETGGEDHQDRLGRERRRVELGRLEPGGVRDGRQIDDARR